MTITNLWFFAAARSRVTPGEISLLSLILLSFPLTSDIDVLHGVFVAAVNLGYGSLEWIEIGDDEREASEALSLQERDQSLSRR